MFKVGDKIVFVIKDNFNLSSGDGLILSNGLTLYKTYTISKLSSFDGNIFYFIRNDSGLIYGYRETKFIGLSEYRKLKIKKLMYVQNR